MPRKQFADLILNTVADAFESHIVGIKEDTQKEVDGKIQIIADSLDKTQRLILLQAYKTSKESIRVQHPDYVHYEKEIDEYVHQTGIGLEEAYFVIKGRHIKDEPSAEETESERPSGVFGRRGTSTPSGDSESSSRSELASQARQEPTRSGRSGFREMLTRGLDKAVK